MNDLILVLIIIISLISNSIIVFYSMRAITNLTINNNKQLVYAQPTLYQKPQKRAKSNDINEHPCISCDLL